MIPVDRLVYVNRADVYKGEDLAGQLVRNESTTRFIYDPRYLQAGLEPVSIHLPLTEKPVETRPGELPPFFANLLPEGIRLIAISRAVKTSLDDHFTLLLAVGRSLVGDVSVVPEEVDPSASHDDDLQDLETISQSAEGYQPGVGVAGVQPKVSSRMLTVPVQSKGEHYLVKFAPPDLPLLVENEAFFLAAAAHCGLEVVTAHMIMVKDRRALAVKRFDRHWVQGRIVRSAQEDGCQILDIYPGDKYRVSWRQMADGIQANSSLPRRSLNLLAGQMAFSYLIGNGDQHAKNVSLVWNRENDVVLSPAYDVISTLPYPGFNQRMALELDGRADKWRRSDFVTFFDRLQVPEKATAQMLDTVTSGVDIWIDTIDEIGFDKTTTVRVRDSILWRRDRLSSASHGA